MGNSPVVQWLDFNSTFPIVGTYIPSLLGKNKIPLAA